MVAIFFGLPTAYALGWIPVEKIPFLLVVFAAVTLALARDAGFDRSVLRDVAALRNEGPRIFKTFAAGALGITLFTAVALPDFLFDMPREEPIAWLVLLIAYPLVSVFPQEILFRTFFYHRYASLFPGVGLRIAVNAAAFGYMHVAYGNWIAVLATAIGGLLFAYTYERTRSTPAVSVEHALYGCWMFTVGLGSFLS